MWQLLARKTQVYLLVALTVALILGIQAAFELWDGTRPNLLKMISLVAFLIATVVVLGANKIWRWIWRKLPFLSGTFFPDLNGTWEGHLVSTWIDPDTKKPLPPIPTKITIRQTLFDISIKQKTNESTSHSHRVIAEADPDADRYRLWYDYDNQPQAAFHFRSNQHQGVAWLEISLTETPDELAGQYYTNRKTSGDINVKRTSV